MAPLLRSQTSSSRSARIPSLATRIGQAYDRVYSSDLCVPLCDRDIREDKTPVVWYSDGKVDRLVRQADLKAFQDSESGVPPESVILSTVALISPTNYGLTSDGNYTGPTPFTRSLADVKPWFYAEIPLIEPFKGDWGREALINLRSLQDRVGQAGVQRKGLFPASGRAAFKIRYVPLFERKPFSDEEAGDECGVASEAAPSGHENTENMPANSTAEGTNNTNSAEISESAGASDSRTGDVASDPATQTAADSVLALEELGTQFQIENWPVVSDQAKQELEGLKATHFVNPIPAYEVGGRLILPDLYADHLKGATAEVFFTLSHWHIPANAALGRSASDCYVADLVSLRVLMPPQVAPSTPTKRRVLPNDPMSSPGNASPTKRRRE